MFGDGRRPWSASRAALMQHLFTKGTGGEPTKQTEIGGMPQSWLVGSLGNVIVSGPQNGLYKPLDLYGDGTPIVRIDNFDNEGAFSPWPSREFACRRRR